MAPSPTIPTSFVPKQPVRSPQRFSKSGGNLFLFIAVVFLLVALLGSGGVFAYQKYLERIRDDKKETVVDAQDSVEKEAIEDFTRTRDRFREAKKVLDSHVAASQFFDLLEEMTLQNVRFDSLSFTLTQDRSAEIRMEGVARTFNALAAQSSLFAGEGKIRRAIFSDITVREADETVSFTLTADLKAELLVLSETSAPAAPAPSEDMSASGAAEGPEAPDAAPAEEEAPSETP